MLLTAVLNQHLPGTGVFAPYLLEMGIKYKFDPLLVAAVAFKESRCGPKKVSRTNDYGLMQLHVSKRCHRRYIGREHLLLDPKRNIRLGAKMMRMWKSFHHRKCRGRHHWLNHYNQGVKVSRKKWHRGYADRVMKIYKQLKKIEISLAGTV